MTGEASSERTGGAAGSDRGLGAIGVVALLLIGAVGGLIGDAGHVVSATTVYLDDSLPFVWESQLWFPLMVGAGTVALGWIRVAFGPDDFEVRSPLGPAFDALAMIAAVVGLYLLTAAVIELDPVISVAGVYAATALIVVAYARSGWDLTCGLLAVVGGVGTEMLFAALELFEYTAEVPAFLGVATWLPGLYLAYGVVAGRLGLMLARA